MKKIKEIPYDEPITFKDRLDALRNNETLIQKADHRFGRLNISNSQLGKPKSFNERASEYYKSNHKKYPDIKFKITLSKNKRYPGL